MGNLQYISSYQTTEVTNNVLVSATSDCKATVSNKQNGNRVIITDHFGDILLGQQLNFNSSCVIANDIQSQIVNQIAQKANNELSSQQSLMASLVGLDLGSSKQRIDAVQTAVINNKISQIMNNSCQSVVTGDQNNNIVVLKGGTGKFTLIQSANTQANCQFTNVSRISISNVVDQAMKNSVKLINSLIAIIIAIAIVIGICVIAALVLKMRANSSKKGEDTNIDNENEESINNLKQVLDSEEGQQFIQTIV